MIFPQLEKLKVVFDLDLISGEEVFSKVVSSIKEFSDIPTFSVHGEEVDIITLKKMISAKKSWPSGVVSCGFGFRFGVVKALEHCFLIIEELEPHKPVSWDTWAAPFLSSLGFIQAWVSNIEYEHWQNAEDPLEYESFGRDHSLLPKRSNGLPPPLEQLEIDTSNNPGRVELRKGYIEAVGATMWLSKLLVSNLKSNVFGLRDSGLCKVTDLGQVFKIEVQVRCFKSSTGEEAEIQNELRRSLFGVCLCSDQVSKW